MTPPAPADGRLREVMADLPVRVLSGRVWHQGPTRYPVASFPDPARTQGRYHRFGGPGVWYASSREQAAWAELFRHVPEGGVDPFEVRRRVGRIHVDGLQVLDLTSPQVQAALGLDASVLGRDDYRLTQQIAAAAREAGCEGILAPSAALPGCRTLVVFTAGRPRLTVEREAVRRPPQRLARLVPAIRPYPDSSDRPRNR